MSWRQISREIFVGLFSGAVGAASIIVAHAHADGATAGDWLNFSAVLLGVFLTVAGTLGIQHYSEWRNYQPVRKHILFMVEELAKSTQAFVDGSGSLQEEADYAGLGSVLEKAGLSQFEMRRDMHFQMSAWSQLHNALKPIAGGLRSKDGRSAQLLTTIKEMRRLVS